MDSRVIPCQLIGVSTTMRMGKEEDELPSEGATSLYKINKEMKR